MGDCKDTMKDVKNRATSPKVVDLNSKKKGDKVFGIFKSKKRMSENPEQTARTLADDITGAKSKVDALIQSKQQDLDTETGREGYNRQALDRLKTMQFHLDEFVEVASEYADS